MKFYVFKYHEVTDEPQSSGFINKGAFPYKHSKKNFNRDLEILIAKFNQSKTIEQCIENYQSNLLLTFDDGGLSAMYIAQQLKKFNSKAYFFIVTNQINKKNFLNIDQIRKLSNQGHIIGTHSHTHPRLFRDLTMKQKIYEWSESKKIIEDIINKKVLTASIPGGDLNDQTIEAASLSGLKYLFTSEPGLKKWSKYGVECFPAFCPKKDTSKKYIINWANGKDLIRLKFIRQTKNVTRKYLKPIYKFYLKLYSIIK